MHALTESSSASHGPSFPADAVGVCQPIDPDVPLVSATSRLQQGSLQLVGTGVKVYRRVARPSLVAAVRDGMLCGDRDGPRRASASLPTMFVHISSRLRTWERSPPPASSGGRARACISLRPSSISPGGTITVESDVLKGPSAFTFTVPAHAVGARTIAAADDCTGPT